MISRLVKRNYSRIKFRQKSRKHFVSDTIGRLKLSNFIREYKVVGIPQSPQIVEAPFLTSFSRTGDGQQTIPLHGLNSLTLIEFLNHSETPNLRSLMFPTCTCHEVSSSAAATPPPVSEKPPPQQQSPDHVILSNHRSQCALVRTRFETIDEWNEWEASRDIMIGEELTINYRESLPDPHYYNTEVAPFQK
jgi:hypothetical protein